MSVRLHQYGQASDTVQFYEFELRRRYQKKNQDQICKNDSAISILPMWSVGS